MPPLMSRRPARGTTFRPSTAGASVPSVQFGLFDSPLGPMLIAASAFGICHIALGDDPAALQRELHATFPEAAAVDDSDSLTAWAQEIVRRMLGEAPATKLPLDPLGTPFQKRVWTELQRIPLGRTRSYQAIAARIGQPTAARAVAQACARNPVAIAIPCHRVVREGGELGGYRWGVARKQSLLDAEQATVETPAARTS